MKLSIFNEMFMISYWVYDLPRDEMIKLFPNENFNDGKCWVPEKNIIAIWFDNTKQKEFCLLEHEIFHAVMITSLLRRMDFNDENDEVGAYLCQWLHKKIKEKI